MRIKPFSVSFAIRLLTVEIIFASVGAATIPRTNVLEERMKFANGATFAREFTVDTEGDYWLAIRLPVQSRSEPRNPTLFDAFSADFAIRANSTIIVSGNSAAEPRAAVVSKDTTTRILARFRAKVGLRYNLAFRVAAVDSKLQGLPVSVQIFLDPHVRN
jgi:hypothetical protein